MLLYNPTVASNVGVLKQLGHNNFPTYSVGVQLALPLRNRAARADALRDELEVRRQQIGVRQLEKQIRLEVTNASIAVEEARDTYEATKSERISQEQTLDAEKQKLDVGASTSFFVIQYQRDLAAAKSAEISPLANYQKKRRLRCSAQLARFWMTIRLFWIKLCGD